MSPPVTITPCQLRTLHRMFVEGRTLAEMSSRTGIPSTTIWRARQRWRGRPTHTIKPHPREDGSDLPPRPYLPDLQTYLAAARKAYYPAMWDSEWRDLISMTRPDPEGQEFLAGLQARGWRPCA